MAIAIEKPEVFGISETSITLSYDIVEGGALVDAESSVWLNGSCRAHIAGSTATRLVRIEGLEAGTDYELELRAGDATAPDDPYFPRSVRTLDAPAAPEVASFATLNDLHFGEPCTGGILDDEMENTGKEKPGYPLISEHDTDVPYWRFMNDDAIAAINAAGVDRAIIKGDIADRGEEWQFDEAARSFARFAMPHDAFLGNHDYYARNHGKEIDGYALLGQEPAPRWSELGGFRLVFLETALPGEHHGVFEDDRLAWLSDTLDETRATEQPTLIFMHHQPVPHDQADKYPNSIGMEPDHSLKLYQLLGRHPQVQAVLIGHTHRNRVRLHPESDSLRYVEVACTKDYPGGWGHYRLFEDGSVRQEVRRTSSARALVHSTRCRDMYGGFYRVFALGTLGERSLDIRRGR